MKPKLQKKTDIRHKPSKNPTILTVSDTEYTVNNKRVYRDMEGNWIGHSDMTSKEVSAFQQFINRKNQK